MMDEVLRLRGWLEAIRSHHMKGYAAYDMATHALMGLPVPIVPLSEQKKKTLQEEFPELFKTPSEEPKEVKEAKGQVINNLCQRCSAPTPYEEWSNYNGKCESCFVLNLPSESRGFPKPLKDAHTEGQKVKNVYLDKSKEQE